MTSPNYYWYYVNTRYKNTFLYSIVQKLKFVKFRGKEKKMKLDKILGRTGTILEVIAIFILIFKAKSMIVTTANWIEFVIVFSSILLDLLYNKM